MNSEFNRLISLIEGRLKALPKVDYRNTEATRAYNSGLESIFGDLIIDEGARCGNDGRGASIRLAGIRASSTMGINGALVNWLTAARKRIQANAGAGAA